MIKVYIILFQIILLSTFYYLGTFLQRTLDLPIAGSILGLMMLFIALKLQLVPAHWVEKGSSFLLKILPLFLVPPTVGVINYFQVFTGGGKWLILLTEIKHETTANAAGFKATVCIVSLLCWNDLCHSGSQNSLFNFFTNIT